MQPRVAFVTDIVTPYTVAVLDALGRRCDLTAVFCSRGGSRGLPWRFDGALPFRHELIEGLTVPRGSPDGTDYYLSPRVAAALRRAGPDAVISAGYSFPSLYAAAFARVTGAPLLLHSDGTSDSEGRLRPEQRLARRVLLRLAWGAVGNSEPAVRRLLEIGFPAGRVFRAPHSTRIEPLWRVAERRQPSRGRALRLLTVGRLVPWKGVDLLLRAVARASGDGADVRLMIAGTGPAEQRLRALAERLGVDVRWHGFVDQAGLPAVYAAADAFAFPTLSEPFGIVMLEAAASGLPLIASPHAGATLDLVRDGVNGIVAEPSDVSAFSAAIRRLAADPALRRTMGEAAHASTRDRTPEATASGYLEAVEAAIADSRSR